jgi:hypothetical protein
MQGVTGVMGGVVDSAREFNGCVNKCSGNNCSGNSGSSDDGSGNEGSGDEGPCELG